MSEAAVQTATAGGVCTITLNRPAALNALNQDLAVGLRDAVLAAEQDQSARCLVIRGGQNFMAGGDLKWFDDLVRSRRPEQNRIEFERFAGDVHGVIVSLRRMPKPVVASVRGAARRVRHEPDDGVRSGDRGRQRLFSLAYSLIGASPDGGSTFALPRIVGAKKAMEIALLSDRFDAATAERLGLVNRVVPAAALDDETARLAARLAGGPTAVYGRTKQLLNASLNSTLESQLQREAEAFAQSASEPALQRACVLHREAQATVASLKGKTLFITGGSRGIGLAIALRAAADGANVIAAKTVEPHPSSRNDPYRSARDRSGGRPVPAAAVRHPRRGAARARRSGRGRALRASTSWSTTRAPSA